MNRETVTIVSGRDALGLLDGELDDLHAQCGVGITGRREWLRVWAMTHSDRPVAIIVRRTGSTAIEGAALLATTSRFGVLHVHVLGHGLSDHVRFPCTTDEAAETLADALATWLTSQGCRWRMHLEHLDPADPVWARLAARLRYTRFSEGPVSLWTTIGPDRSARRSNRHYRNAVNRLAQRGLSQEVVLLEDAPSIESSLADIERVRRRRDSETGVLAELDRSSSDFWHEVTAALADTGQLFAALLRIGDGATNDLAAYAVCMWDGSTVRFWDGRINPSYANYSPGLLLHQQLLDRVMHDQSITAIDWGRGDAPYKRRFTNDVQPSLDFRAWSSWGLENWDAMAAAVRTRLASVKNRNPRLRRVWARVRALR